MKKLLVLLIFIGCSIIGFGQQDSVFTIEGTVWDLETGELLEGGIVFLIENNVKLDSIKLPKDGMYKFEMLNEGCYNVSIKFHDYDEQFSIGCYSLKKGKPLTQYLYFDKLKILKNPYGNVISCGYKFPDSLKFTTQIIIEDESKKVIADAIFLLIPESRGMYTNLPKFQSDDNNRTTTVELGLHIPYKIMILKEGYELIDKTITISEPVKHITITLKKEN